MVSEFNNEDNGIRRTTIRELTPRALNLSSLKMRLIWKSKPKRPSKMDSLVDIYRRFKFMDENRDEIFAVAYGRLLCNKLGKRLKHRRVYNISNYGVQTASKKYSSIKTELSLIFSSDTEIVWMKNVAAFPQRIPYNFVKFDQLDTLQNDDIVDLVGVVVSAGEYQSYLNSVPPYRKLELVLCDDTSQRRKVALWGKHARTYNDKQLDYEKLTTLTMKGAKANIFNQEITFNLNEEAELRFNPKLEEVKELRKWWSRHNVQSTINSAGTSNDP